MVSRPTARVALETTLLAHGVPRDAAMPLYDELVAIIEREGSQAAAIGITAGRARADLTRDEVLTLLDSRPVKMNTANVGLAMFRKSSGATTVSTTMEIAAANGIAVFATGGLGGVHKHYGTQLDVSADLAAFARFPVAVVASGVKSILDVVATRELLESLGVPVIGFRTDRFPAFTVSDSNAGVDGRFDDEEELADFLRFELGRTGRGVLVCNPVPMASAIASERFAGWLAEAEHRASEAGVSGRGVTPFVLGALAEISAGETLRANLALVKNNARLAARLASRMG